jgi:hypothetical protein
LIIIQNGTCRDLFFGIVDTTREYGDAHYIAEHISSFIAKVRTHNVVQNCTNNAIAMENADCTMMQSNPHIYIQGCAAHYLDLLLEAWD